MCVAEDCTELCDADSLVTPSHPVGKEMTPGGSVIASSMKGRPTSGCWRPDDPTAKTDWIWQRCDYRDEQLCEMCHKERPRYVHTMEHPVDGTKAVGKVCAAWMISPAPSGWPEEAQRQVANRVARARARAKTYRMASDLTFKWMMGDLDESVLFMSRDMMGSVIARAARDEDPELPRYEELWSHIIRGVRSCEMVDRSVQWWREDRYWMRRGSGSSFEFCGWRAWTFQRDGLYGAAYAEIRLFDDETPIWSRGKWADEDDAQVAVELALGKTLVAKGIILPSSHPDVVNR